MVYVGSFNLNTLIHLCATTPAAVASIVEKDEYKEYIDGINTKINNQSLSTKQIHSSNKTKALASLSKNNLSKKKSLVIKLHPMLKAFSK